MARIQLCIVSAVALVTVSCQDHVPPTAAPPTVSAEFRDAMHGGGNPHFYLLPPFVSVPDLTKETFESGLQPSVRVTELPGAPGTAFAGCTDEQITYLPGSEFTGLKAYAAFWRPANFSNVTAPCIYRLQVEVFGTALKKGFVLGFADVQVLSKTTLKYLKTGQYIPLPKDLTLPFWFFIGQGAVFYAQSGGTDACRADRDCVEAVVSPAKDNVVLTKNQKAGIFIPQGAFAATVTLIIEQQTERPCIPASKLGLPQFNASGSGCYRYRRFPSDVALNKDLTVAMCVDVGGLTHEQADRLQIFRFDPDEVEGGDAQALANASAAFLPCPPTGFGFAPTRGAAIFDALRALLAPASLHAANAVALIHAGIGGSCLAGRCLSSPFFTWGIPGAVSPNSADPQTTGVGTSVAAPPSVLVMDMGVPTLEIAPHPLPNATVIFRVTTGGGGIATPASATSGTTDTLTTDANGIATLGRWTLGSTPGTNTVEATVAGASSSPVTFTATGLASPLIDCAGAPGDEISRGFYVPQYPGVTLDHVTLHLSTATAGTYTFSLTARTGSYDGALIGTSTATVALPASEQTSVETKFDFSTLPVSEGSLVTFTISIVSGPETPRVLYDVPVGDATCPVIETNDTSPPLSTFRRNGVRVKIEGGAAPVVL